jgi:hypothetical protein
VASARDHGRVPQPPDPRAHFGFAPGRAGRLADWEALCGYFFALGAATPWARVWTIGHSTEGRPLLAVALAAPELLDRLEVLAAARRAEARGEPPPEPVPDIAVVVQLCGTHAAEATAPQASPETAHLVLTSPPLRRTLGSVVFVLVPAVDPDGLDRMCAWVRGEGAQAGPGMPPPGAHRRYAGHDINRDWIMQTQPEVRAVAEGIFHRLLPQVCLDMHEMWSTGPRLFLPPYAPPADPTVDPAVLERAGHLGRAIAERLRTRGLRGVATEVLFDAFSPARGYPHHHGCVRILCEAATAGLAAEVDLPAARLRPVAGLDPRVPSPAQPDPWPGGRWTAEDVVRYQQAVTAACLELVGAEAREWVAWQREVFARARDPSARPGVYVLPAGQPDPAAADELIGVLRRGGLEVHAGPGGAVVPRAQPFGTWADALLEPVPYPGATGRRGRRPTPYDVTAHYLPALMGVHCLRAAGPEGEETREGPAGPVRADPSPAVWSARDTASYRLVFTALAQGRPVWRVPAGAAEDVPPGGAFGVGEPPAAWRAVAERLAPPRVAVYGSWKASSDEGWLRYVLDRFGLPYTVLRDADIQAGVTGYTHLILPSLRGRDLMHGLPPDRYPARYAGGLGERGRAELRAFVRAGGCLLAVEWAAAWVHAAFALPLADRTLEPRSPIAVAGAALAVRPGTGPLTFGVPERTWVLYRDGPAFVAPPEATAARFSGEPPAAGLARGLHALAGCAAVVDLPWGRGRCRLYAFSPYFRAQSWAAFRWLFNGLLT